MSRVAPSDGMYLSLRIQQSASIIYDMEQSENPQRGLRLTQSLRGGAAPRASRPLTELIANKLLYKILHMQFTWLLRVGGTWRNVFPKRSVLLDGATRES